MSKKRILIIVDYYIPGYKSGGPLRTISNMVEKLGDEFSFKIVTRDRDEGDTEPYKEVEIDQWQPIGKAEVLYLSPQQFSLTGFWKIFSSTEYDVLYLNSFFSPYCTIRSLLLRRLKLTPKKPIIIAPRGEFASSAISSKILKKFLYLAFAKLFGLYSNVIWQASSIYEKKDICRWFGSEGTVHVAPDFPPTIQPDKLPAQREKSPGKLNCIFLSRIERGKNLNFALKILKEVKKEIQFNIYGPIENKTLWAECKNIIGQLPQNIIVNYCDTVVHEKVLSVMSSHELFFLPTKGENFGHVIIEALIAGCPVLISNRTPWQRLEEKGVGWDLPLDQPKRFKDVLETCVDMDAQTYRQFSGRARAYGLSVTQDQKVIEQNRSLFIKALIQD